MLAYIAALIKLTAAVDSAHAGLILSLSPSLATVNANGSNLGSITINVQGAADSGTQTLRAYDIYIDIDPIGTAKPAGWTVNTPVEGFDVEYFLPSASPLQANVRASGGYGSINAINLSSTPTTLWSFELDFDADNGATNGIYELSFFTGGTFEVRDINSNLITSYSTSGNTITLQNLVATPEPSTLLLFSLAGISWGSHRWIRRRSKRPIKDSLSAA